MNIQVGNGVQAYQYSSSISAISVGGSARSASSGSIKAENTADAVDRVTISDTARKRIEDETAAQNSQDVQKNLGTIKAKPAAQRTAAEQDYLSRNDQRLAELENKTRGKGPDALTADELNYMQKAKGMVNTMANLSPKEKALYDDFVAKGNTEAAHGLALIALSREAMAHQEVMLPNGQSFNPTTTEVTAESVRRLFSLMFVDTDGSSARAFEALASALDRMDGDSRPG